MLELKITIAAPDLSAALNNLAAALNSKNSRTVCNQYDTDNKHIDDAGTINTDTINMGTGGEAQPVMPVNPTTARATPQTVVPVTMHPTVNPSGTFVAPEQVPGAPISAMPIQTSAQVAPTAPATPQVSIANITPAPAAVPTAAPQYTLDMLASAGSALIDAGKIDQLMQLLGKFGVASLTELPPESYGALACELRALGATL